MPTNHKPVKIFKAGAVEAALFENERGEERQCVIKLSRRYSDTQGYHRTNSFHERDLANAELVLHAARRYLTLNTITPRAGQPGSPNQVNSGELDTDDHSS